MFSQRDLAVFWDRNKAAPSKAVQATLSAKCFSGGRTRLLSKQSADSLINGGLYPRPTPHYIFTLTYTPSFDLRRPRHRGSPSVRKGQVATFESKNSLKGPGRHFCLDDSREAGFRYGFGRRLHASWWCCCII
ncbi:Serine hydroxymethyltransferase 2 [Clarias magur]|uniref:Serine hydroxymethyltransferase 2 n=1 Tax=Clarias magur TaxID=1594786 RepID=A0A8J4X246_CLAMG|nr:Serine hydroxymethyltransferase 2 [Clarias magur]